MVDKLKAATKTAITRWTMIDGGPIFCYTLGFLNSDSELNISRPLYRFKVLDYSSHTNYVIYNGNLIQNINITPSIKEIIKHLKVFKSSQGSNRK